MADCGNITTPDAGDLNEAARKCAASRGWALPGGRYPIRSKEMHGASDLQKAIKAVGRGGGSHDAIRRHIMKRARALGLSDQIPDNWTSGGASQRSVGSGYRFFEARLRAELDGNRLMGHAAVYDQVARVPGGYERFQQGAFDQVIDQGQDVVAAINHDMSMVLGRRSSGTLQLKSDETGLLFEVDLPDTSYARDLRELVRRGDVTGASVGYVPARGGETYSRSRDGATLATVTNVERLRDVSPVTLPAYVGTDVSLRFEDFRPTGRSQLIRARYRATIARERVNLNAQVH